MSGGGFKPAHGVGNEPSSFAFFQLNPFILAPPLASAPADAAPPAAAIGLLWCAPVLRAYLGRTLGLCATHAHGNRHVRVWA